MRFPFPTKKARVMKVITYGKAIAGGRQPKTDLLKATNGKSTEVKTRNELQWLASWLTPATTCRPV